MIIIEFHLGMDISEILQDVKDAVDKARNELPNDLPYDPLVMDIDPSEFPIMNLNLSGDFSNDELARIEDFMKAPELPLFLKNRRNDFDSGDDLHMSGMDLKVFVHTKKL